MRERDELKDTCRIPTSSNGLGSQFWYAQVFGYQVFAHPPTLCTCTQKVAQRSVSLADDKDSVIPTCVVSFDSVARKYRERESKRSSICSSQPSPTRIMTSFLFRLQILGVFACVSSVDPAQLNTGRLSHSYHWHDEHGNYFHLNHTASHPPDLVLLTLDAYADELELECSSTTMSLRPSSPKLRRILREKFQPDTIITGSSWWNCTNSPEGHPEPILRRLSALQAQNNDALTFVGSTEEAEYTDVFSHANISLATNMVRSPQPTVATTDATTSATASRRHLNSAEDTFRTLANKAGCNVANTPSWVPSSFGFVAKFAMLSSSALMCVAQKARSAVATLGEIVVETTEFVGQLASGTVGPVTFTQPIGAWTANYEGAFRQTLYSHHIENGAAATQEGRRLEAVASQCLNCSTRQASSLSQCGTPLPWTSRACLPHDGTSTLVLPGGGQCDYSYSSGKVRSAQCTISQADLISDSGSAPSEQSRRHTCALDACNCDQAGHILADSLGGCGDCPINIFPQNAELNMHGGWKTLESSVRSCLQAGQSGSAQLEWAFQYADTASKRPSSVTYGVVYLDGTCESQSKTFANECSHPPAVHPSSVVQAKESIDLEGGIACTNCFAVARADVVFNLEIAQHSVKVAEAFAEGHAKVNVEATADLSGQYTNSYERSLGGPIKFPVAPITFTVGPVPISLDFVVSTKVGYSVHAEGAVNLQFGAAAEGALKFGVSYRKERPEQESCADGASSTPLQVVSKADWTGSGRLPQLSADVTIGAEVYLTPTVALRVWKIGGPTLAVKAYLEASAEAQGQASSRDIQGCLQAAANIGVQLAVGAKLSLPYDLLNKELKSQTVFSTKWSVGELEQSCVGDAGGRQLQSISPPPPPAQCQGRSENGPSGCKSTPGCGWCIDDDYNAECCSVTAFNAAVLPCATSSGRHLTNCNKGLSGQDLTPEQEAQLGRAFPIGKVFTGTLRRVGHSSLCSGVPDLVLLSMQVMRKPIVAAGLNTVTDMDLLVTLSSASDQDAVFAGLDQRLWTAQILYGEFLMERSQLQAAANTQTCTTKTSSYRAAQDWTAGITRWIGQASLGTMVLRDSLGCTEVELSRGSTWAPPPPPFAPPPPNPLPPILPPPPPPILPRPSPPPLPLLSPTATLQYLRPRLPPLPPQPREPPMPPATPPQPRPPPMPPAMPPLPLDTSLTSERAESAIGLWLWLGLGLGGLLLLVLAASRIASLCRKRPSQHAANEPMDAVSVDAVPSAWCELNEAAKMSAQMDASLGASSNVAACN